MLVTSSYDVLNKTYRDSKPSIEHQRNCVSQTISNATGWGHDVNDQSTTTKQIVLTAEILLLILPAVPYRI